MTIQEAVSFGNTKLKTAGIETFSLDTSLLLSHALRINRTLLYAKGQELLPEESFAVFHKLIERRINGECIAYITEKKEFRGLEFFVNSSVLVPRPDTETLVETALIKLAENIESKVRGQRIIRVLDLCTGSGAVAIALKYEMPEIEVFAIDICADALEVAKINAERLLPAKNSVHFYQGDLFDALPSANCSLIISNPPYIPTDEIKKLSIEVQNEPRLALDGGESGLEVIKRIIESAPLYLENGGILLMEADTQQMQDIAILLDKRGFKDIELYKDLGGHDRVIGGKYEI